jgi:HK97 family phage prohead protease
MEKKTMNPEFPRDDLFRMVELAPAEVEFRAEKDATHIGVLTGYAAVFNSPTEINGWEGRFFEILAQGSFDKTLRERGSRVKVLFNHGFDPSIGDKPLGKPAVMEERDKGLWVEVPLDDTSYNRDLVASLRSGALDGMSFRFSVVKEDVDESGTLPVRTVRELKLYEFGPVTFPAYEATTVGVRSRSAYEAYRHNNLSSASEAASGTSVETTDEPLTALDGETEKQERRRTRLWVVRLNETFPETRGN